MVQKEEITITTEYIKLDSLLKFAGICGTGGEAKEAILAGDVSYNGQVCLERGKKIRSGDKVTLPGVELTIL